MELTLLSQIIAFVIALTVHEASHALIAYRMGDPTAKYKGRLTMNPLKHIDPFGTVILPISLLFIGFPFVFGYAKPVPVNPYNLRGKYADIWVSLAGPLSNLIVSFSIIMFIRFIPEKIVASWSLEFYKLFLIIAETNIAIGIFNLIPIPPLDGSKVLLNILPSTMVRVKDFITRYGALLLVFVFFVAKPILFYSVYWIMTLFYGNDQWLEIIHNSF